MSDVHLIRAIATSIPLPDESVQCVVTSPPYWGLRKYAGEQELIWYQNEMLSPAHGVHCPHQWLDESEENRDIRTGLGLAEWSKQHARGGGLKPAKIGTFTIHRGTCVRCGAWRGAYGLEPTVEMYVEHTVQILREIRRVLRKDGVVFWNIGDSYCSGAYTARPPSQTGTDVGGWTHEANQIPRNGKPDGLKPKDLVLMPSRVALAAQADGWWVRSMIIWAKPNPMPESVTDRPTDSYEHIILLAKSERYFWDATAVREQATAGWNGSTFDTERKDEIYQKEAYGYTPKGTHSRGTGDGGPKAQQRGSYEGWADGTREVLGTRNVRNVWMFATQPYSGAHFATFPEELPRRCILAATSEKGACQFCGTPWRRVSESDVHFEGGSGKAAEKRIPSAGWHQSGSERWQPDHQERFVHDGGKHKAGAYTDQVESGDYDIRMGPVLESRTIGWQPGCRCRGQHNKTVPCVVLDPFGGSGTTGRVALELNRTAYLVDVAYGPDGYEKLARERTSNVQRNLVGL